MGRGVWVNRCAEAWRLRGAHIAVAERLLDHAAGDSLLQQVHGERMKEGAAGCRSAGSPPPAREDLTLQSKGGHSVNRYRLAMVRLLGPSPR
jgi:hypothetical protein